MHNRLLYHLIIIPFSRLPLWLLYCMSDFLYLLIITLIPYRRKVAFDNLLNCFPELSKKERKKLLRRNYHHICDILAESIKNLGISQRELKKRFVIENLEVFDKLNKNGKSVIVISSHYSNWEFLITAQNLIIPQLAIGIGKPLSRKFLNKKINSLRERNGMIVVSALNYKEEIVSRLKTDEKMAILALADQAPTPENAFWTRHFSIETPFPFGPEFMAHQYDFPVIFLATRQVRRGYYVSKAELITDKPKAEPFGKIMQTYAKLLEKQIREKPEDWLWTHKRWKHPIPENIEEIKNNQRKFFHKRFPNAPMD